MGGGGGIDGDNRTPLAAGGYASGNHPYYVGEEGPEIVVPNASSYVIASDKIDDVLGGADLSYEEYTSPTYGWSNGDEGDQSSYEKAAGGYISAGMPAIVGDKGPELVVPNASSYVIANNRLDDIFEDGNPREINNYYYTLNMPTTAQPTDVIMAYELMKSFGGN